MPIPPELDIFFQAQSVPENHRITLRRLKSRLLRTFPDSKSSHLTESIAFALNFQSNAALIASRIPDSIAIASFDPIRFSERMLQLQGFFLNKSIAEPEVNSPPAQLLELVEQSTSIGHSSLNDFQNRTLESVKSNALNRAAAQVIAEVLNLGNPDVSTFPHAGTQGRYEGVDHASCVPGWGRMVSLNREGFLDDLSNGSVWQFKRELPLTGGGSRKYVDAVLTLTHDRGHWRATQKTDTEHQATVRGWTCTALNGWFGDAEPMLIRRSTTHERMLELWETSFVRWVCENQGRLKMLNEHQAWQLAVEDVVECPHIPLDLTSFEDLSERYLAEVPYPTYGLPDVGQVQVLEILISKWRHESNR
ncbi:hypothetical protein [Pseudomonas gozinkensis]|uniref:hypothetical protein n=1 Tax=Pseudomonas gozinkensis TaxID=2774461 RepID=UPI0017889915|nr:hypothetical protein [Pseudomonas gozinkensis]